MTWRYAPFLQPKFIGWVMLVGGIIAFASSFILTVEKIQLLQDPTAHLPCNLNPIISCGSVMKTEQASVFGFTNSLIGVAGFAMLAALGLAVLAGAQFKRWFWLGIQAGMLFGLAFVHWLFFESVYRIGSLCPFCMVVWVVVITSTWYITLFNLRSGYIQVPGRLTALKDFALARHGDILALWFVVLIALILQHFWYYFGGLLVK